MTIARAACGHWQFGPPPPDGPPAREVPDADRPLRRVRRFLALAAALALPATAGAADGSLSVTVRDNYGVIPRAAVRATNGATGVGQRAVTDDAGCRPLRRPPRGHLRGAGGFPGFADAAEPAVALAEGEAKSLELVLGVAQLSTSLTIETANRREQLLLDVAEPVTLIEKTQIEDTGARSAKDVLVEQNGSGIQVNAGGGQGYVSINGIPNKGVLVLVNGRRYLGKDANGNLNLEELRLPGVERIEVVKGAGSALYGSDALGGVVNFITGQPTERGVTNSLTLSAGSYDDYRVDDSLLVARQPGRGRASPAATAPTTASTSSPARRSCRRPRAASRTRRRSASPRARTGTPRAPPTSRSRRSSWPASSATTSSARSATTSSPARPSSPPPSTTPSAT